MFVSCAEIITTFGSKISIFGYTVKYESSQGYIFQALQHFVATGIYFLPIYYYR